jgi:hypothetical protein
MPCQVPLSTAGRFSSLKQGRFFKASRRFVPETAIPLSWFWITKGAVGGAPLMMVLLSLATTPRMAAAPPL